MQVLACAAAYNVSSARVGSMTGGPWIVRLANSALQLWDCLRR